MLASSQAWKSANYQHYVETFALKYFQKLLEWPFPHLLKKTHGFSCNSEAPNEPYKCF